LAADLLRGASLSICTSFGGSRPDWQDGIAPRSVPIFPEEPRIAIMPGRPLPAMPCRGVSCDAQSATRRDHQHIQQSSERIERAVECFEMTTCHFDSCSITVDSCPRHLELSSGHVESCSIALPFVDVPR